MKKITVIVFLFLLCSIVYADNSTNITNTTIVNDTVNITGVLDRGDYEGMTYVITRTELENVTPIVECFNETTNRTENCTDKIIAITRRFIDISQQDYEYPNESLVPYEPVDYDSWENPVVINETQNETKNNTIVMEVINEIKQAPTEKENKIYDYVIAGLFFVIVVFIVLIVRKSIKLKQRPIKKTPEEQVKELLDAGMDEAYCEDVYKYLKEKDNERKT